MGSRLVKLVNRLKSDQERFWLSKKQWKASSVPDTLDWQWVSFKKSDAQSIPRTRGLYAFTVECSAPGIPPHGYIMYVGEVGHTGNETLRSRFRSYFYEMKRDERPVHYILNKYTKHLFFYFCEVPDRRKSLFKIETALCDTLIPPYNVNDFSMDMKRGVKVL